MDSKAIWKADAADAHPAPPSPTVLSVVAWMAICGTMPKGIHMATWDDVQEVAGVKVAGVTEVGILRFDVAPGTGHEDTPLWAAHQAILALGFTRYGSGSGGGRGAPMISYGRNGDGFSCLVRRDGFVMVRHHDRRPIKPGWVHFGQRSSSGTAREALAAMVQEG